MRTLIILGVLLVSAGGAGAQTVSLRDGALKDWNSQRDTLMKIAAAMPAEKFNFKATPAERTWGEQILHIAEANVNQMGRLGAKAAAPRIDMKLTAPADVLKALADSFAYGTAVLEEQTDATMVQQAGATRFDMGMGPSARVRVVYFVIGHTWDIYGQMVVYLRLNGITPPASQRL
jgi:uncharacterized damage-inducible protein DinB